MEYNGWYAGQSSAVAAQYLLSGQQNQLASGQHPAGQSVSSGPQSVVFNPLSGFTRLAGWYMGQSTSVAAQCLLSAQQNQLASGQHPAGHSVSVTGSQRVLTILVLTAFTFGFTERTAGQSLAVAAQYLLSGQQNQLASGQHPAGHSVSSGPQSPLSC